MIANKGNYARITDLEQNALLFQLDSSVYLFQL